ncbi:hypothetical protein Forpe1208_v016984 [Fusarium oxysporum f. sp. rapae]|uniref:Uncharacterized protein n=1 Tax=Fusarium oxysporum f. sp. rapae TaxID=485398 RepID=A0A8J5NLS8_FUSOX|nr:hypothetical protein Forpe1208_v016984 [Fusarium oxysporum f. sp. rapae]
MTKELKEAVAKQEETVREMGKQMVEIKDQMTEELQCVREQLETIAANATDGPQRSYADVTRLTSFLPHNDSRTLAAPPIPTDMLYCTIDVSRLEEDKARLSAGTIREQSRRGRRGRRGQDQRASQSRMGGQDSDKQLRAE